MKPFHLLLWFQIKPECLFCISNYFFSSFLFIYSFFCCTKMFVFVWKVGGFGCSLTDGHKAFGEIMIIRRKPEKIKTRQKKAKIHTEKNPLFVKIQTQKWIKFMGCEQVMKKNKGNCNNLTFGLSYGPLGKNKRWKSSKWRINYSKK